MPAEAEQAGPATAAGGPSRGVVLGQNGECVHCFFSPTCTPSPPTHPPPPPVWVAFLGLAALVPARKAWIGCVLEGVSDRRIPEVHRMIITSLLAAVPGLVPFVEHSKTCAGSPWRGLRAVWGNFAVADAVVLGLSAVHSPRQPRHLLRRYQVASIFGDIVPHLPPAGIRGGLPNK